ncbi:class I adenylate-forming enzyme family protein [Agromyces kandeliae]|uniref:AMP-binding protein n=1 Tax=Agromyces kandeliae TaxID=2666141 RepID=A0A6L5R751_9MICO|nr:fatty acid--CoA ligase family protein [Agromyces kandeliae]MRX45288.1 AMP-binding protein [Agromyces kandeliae]
MTDLLGASGDRIALSFGGRSAGFDELARAVAGAGLPPGDGPVGCRADGDPVLAITTVLACLDRGRPVLVGGTQRDADRIADDLPAGTELALTTSGSTSADGSPRVVARTLDSWLASAEPLAGLAGLDAHDRVAVTGPLAATMHLYAALHALRIGATVTDDVASATAVHATPTRLARLLSTEAALPRTAIVAGAAMPSRLRGQAAGRGIRVVEYYGAAELSFVLATRHGSDRAPDSGLEPFPGVEVDLRPADAGLELWARSPYLAMDVVGGRMRRDADGFATVGDLAERTPAGGIRVLGRGDSAIITAGATVLAEDVEAHLVALPGVHDAAVVGEPHDLLGERIAAVVELEPGARLEAVADAARVALSPVELPRRWFAADLPRTASGKPARGRLRDDIAAGRLGPGHPPHFADWSRA